METEGPPGAAATARSAPATPPRARTAARHAPPTARKARRTRTGRTARGDPAALKARSSRPERPAAAKSPRSAPRWTRRPWTPRGRSSWGAGRPATSRRRPYAAWATGAAQELRADPWLLLGLEGVRVDAEHADAFARALLGPECGPGDERRVRALVGHLMEKAAQAGHTALPAQALKAALARHAVPDPGRALGTAVEEGQLLVFREDGDLPGGARRRTRTADGAEDARTRPNRPPVPLLFGLDRYALAEESLADGLRTAAAVVRGRRRCDWEAAAAAAPSPSAAELIRTAAGHALVLHTGGEAARAEPAALVAAARAAGLRAYAAAYTRERPAAAGRGGGRARPR